MPPEFKLRQAAGLSPMQKPFNTEPGFPAMPERIARGNVVLLGHPGQLKEILAATIQRRRRDIG